MAGERIIHATFGDLLHTGSEFIDWWEAAFPHVYIPEDYWAPTLGQFSWVTPLPVGYLDRNEILMIPRSYNPGSTVHVAVSVSWTMTLAIGFKGPRGFCLRTAANCWMCRHREGDLETFRCGVDDTHVGGRDRYRLDLGQCPLFLSADPGPLPAFRAPVWWRDSDWPIAPGRYSPSAFDGEKLDRLVAGSTVEPPLRLTPIPLTPREAGGPSGPASPTRERWLGFLSELLRGTPGLPLFLDAARRKDFSLPGGA